MSVESRLKTLLADSDLSKIEKLLLILSFLEGPASVDTLRKTGLELGLRSVKAWNVSSILSRSRGKAILTKDGWELNESGREQLVAKGLVAAVGSQPHPIANQIRKQLGSAKSVDAAAFLEEAIRCFENDFHRAAIVLSWIGAIAVLHDHIINNLLGQFNAEAKRRDAKWKNAVVPDDLSRMKEGEFLDVLETLSVIGKNVKIELKVCLDRRNGCGHPNSLKIGANTVAHHLEILLLNVFSKF